MCLRDPVALGRLLWPDVTFYSKQLEILDAVRHSPEVYVQAGNQLGKDFIAGYLNLTFFVVPQVYFDADYVLTVEAHTPADWSPWLRHRRRAVTTSVKDDHMDVLWGEIGHFYRTCSVDLSPFLRMTHHEMRFADELQAKNPANYLKGQVSATGEGLAGHHAAYTMVTGDEASGLEDMAYTQAATWAKKALYIGNPLQCSNFFRKNCKAGDLRATT